MTGSLVPQWRLDATRLELDSNEPVSASRAPEQISPVEKKKPCASRDARQQVGNWYSVSQIGSLSYGTRNGGFDR